MKIYNNLIFSISTSQLLIMSIAIFKFLAIFDHKNIIKILQTLY